MATIRTAKQRSPVIAEEASKGAQAQEHIARLAYELYEQRGRQEGRDLEDWLEAEQQVIDPSDR